MTSYLKAQVNMPTLGVACTSFLIAHAALRGSGGCPPGNVSNIEINLVQSGAPKRLFDTIFGCTFMSFSLNE